MFLDINASTVELDDAFDLVVEVAAGRFDVEEIADRLASG